jgi:F-type H+-transporting ATPase subunit gamma
MPSLDDLRKRIVSVKSTQKITKAMKMVAAAKLRKAQESAEMGRPFSEKMQNIILNLTETISDPQNAPKLLVGTGKDQIHLCVIMTSDRGLCGGFNSNICRLAKKYFKKILKEGKDLKIITIGSKGHDQLKREYKKYIIKKLSFKNKKKISFLEADEVGKIILDLFDKNEFDKCILFFNNFKNVMTQIPEAQQIIPAEVKKNSNKNKTCFQKIFLHKFLRHF